MTYPTPAPPPGAPRGGERAGLDQLKKMIGSQTTKDDALLGMCLAAAGTWVYDRVHSQFVQEPAVVQAVLMLAARLYKRRQSPEGVTGFAEMGVSIVVSRDPDVERLIEHYVDAGWVWGIG
jgi:hypothetical protein